MDGLYQALDEDPLLETVTLKQAADTLPSTSLSAVYPGSWINHNFRIWIGHDEDNMAWDLLSRARDALVAFEADNQDYDRDLINRAWEQIYIAEGSDWCWWYGDDHRGQYNEQFDQIYRRHLSAVYELIGQIPPMELSRPIHQSGVSSFTIQPDDIMTAQIDGRLSHFYEWAGAGFYDCLKAEDFGGECPGEYQYAMSAICEIALNRKFLWPDGFGRLGLSVRLADGERTLEEWPDQATIDVDVPEPDREIFWPA